MFKEYLTLLLLGHIIADFYTQTAKAAEKKKEKIKWVFIHGLLYFLTMVVISVPVLSIHILALDVATSILHFVIDIGKFLFLKRSRRSENATVFVIDQISHFICLFILSYAWTKMNVQIKEIPVVLDFFCTTDISEQLVCNWILGLLIVHKPANILIQKLISPYKPKAEKEEIKEKDNNVGRVIGTAERIVMLILIYMNQYSAIGLVLTAKSIARYDRITKDEKFAEYYLLGTLISAGIVIVCAAMLFGG